MTDYTLKEIGMMWGLEKELVLMGYDKETVEMFLSSGLDDEIVLCIARLGSKKWGSI